LRPLKVLNNNNGASLKVLEKSFNLVAGFCWKFLQVFVILLALCGLSWNLEVEIFFTSNGILTI